MGSAFDFAPHRLDKKKRKFKSTSLVKMFVGRRKFFMRPMGTSDLELVTSELMFVTSDLEHQFTQLFQRALKLRINTASE